MTVRAPRTGSAAGSWTRRRRRGEELQVPPATFRSYYGRPVLKRPSWKALDVAGYLFLGGLAGASSALAFGCERRGLHVAGRNAQVTAAAAIGLSGVALVHDLGRPARFVNMLRTCKVTSPMSIGSWLLAAYGPAAAAAAISTLSGRLLPVGRRAGALAAVLGPAVAAYTAVLLGDTAVPAWHDVSDELPVVFVASAAMAAAGAALATTPPAQLGPARRLGVAATAVELTAHRALVRHGGLSAEPYHTGRAGRLLRSARWLAAAGTITAVSGTRRPLARAAGGAAWLAASACTRFGVFDAGVRSAEDPRYVVEPQRARLDARRAAARVDGHRAG